jgi:glycogen debranching enzyme
VEERQEYFTNYSSSREDVFRLGVTNSGTESKLIVIAASAQGRAEAEKTYRRLSTGYEDSLRESAKYYGDYLAQTVNLELPDAELQQAYDWSRVSVLQGVVTNPGLGTSLIAGYRSSGDAQRPGFAWFFGRDSLWSSLALNASGDFATTRSALEFLSKYQRADGKIAHEISQAANLVPWFTDYPYAYAAADATPLFIIAADDYVTRSGDENFVRQKWDSLWKAYQFLRSTYDPRGFPQNSGVGHGWVEGGPLLPVKAELYQVGLGAAALRALSHMAALTGKDQASKELMTEFSKQKALLDQMFWSDEKRLFAFAIGADYERVDIPSVLATVPMWFNLLDPDKAEQMLNLLAGPDHETDWGMRIISSQQPKYNPGGYHFGSVWPLFTGWASVGEYRYHREFPAYSNLRANALLALNGSLGHVTEVLSGDYFEPLSTSSPHQIWSAAMVISPILRGMMGIEVDAKSHTLRFSPHVPADWTFFRVRGVPVGETRLDLTYHKTAEGISLQVQRIGTDNCVVDFSPALSLRARVVKAEVNGRVAPVHPEESSEDQHASIHFSVDRPSVTAHIRTHNDFGLALDSALPPLGSASQGLRVVSESWDKGRSTLTLEVAGTSGNEYHFAVWNPAQIASVEGAQVRKDGQGKTTLHVSFAPGPAKYQSGQVKLKFVPR